jgi:asparagine synthase (glutamine-hydrolysing)
LTGIVDKCDPYIDLVDRAGRGREAFWSGANVFSEIRNARLVDRSRLAPLAPPAAMRASGLLPEAFGRPDSYEIVRLFFERIDVAEPGSDVLTRMIYSEFKLRLPELLLMRVDKTGMSVSIEPRLPFLDHLLVELTMNLPMDLKVTPCRPKELLKSAVRGLLPDEVIDCPKRGFGAPMLQWLRLQFGESVRAERQATRFFECFPAKREAVVGMHDRRRTGTAEFSLYVWTIYNAVAWYDYWVDKSRQVRVA